jgi:U4/U6.U5 tri-snRNP-associated protein 3
MNGGGSSKSMLNDNKPIVLDPAQLEGKTPDEIEMMKIMGFAGFDTTKGKKVEDSANAFAINIQQKRKYRQYMNRKGGFNKPLDPVA